MLQGEKSALNFRVAFKKVLLSPFIYKSSWWVTQTTKPPHLVQQPLRVCQEDTAKGVTHKVLIRGVQKLYWPIPSWYCWRTSFTGVYQKYAYHWYFQYHCLVIIFALIKVKKTSFCSVTTTVTVWSIRSVWPDSPQSGRSLYIWMSTCNIFSLLLELNQSTSLHWVMSVATLSLHSAAPPTFVDVRQLPLMFQWHSCSS